MSFLSRLTSKASQFALAVTFFATQSLAPLLVAMPARADAPSSPSCAVTTTEPCAQTDKDNYAVGDEVGVVGHGFAPSSNYQVELSSPADGVSVLIPVVSNSVGSITANYPPTDVFANSYEIIITDSSDQQVFPVVVSETSQESDSQDPKQPTNPLPGEVQQLVGPSVSNVTPNSVTQDTQITPNPPLTQSCGLDVALVIDSSSSINNTELGQMKTAYVSFVDAFLPATPTQFSVTEFDTTASVTQAFTGDATTVKNAINGAVSNGFTNWEDALVKANSTFDPRPTKQNLILFASDGNPNTVVGGSGGAAGESAAVAAAVTQANSIKGAGTRIMALGIGNNLDVDNLKEITGNTLNAGASSDVITTNFSELANTLAALATELCGGTITAKKLIDQDGNLNTTNDQIPAEGWTFDINGDPSNPQPTQTDADGFTPSVEVLPGTYSVNEQLKDGHQLLSATCQGATNNGSQQGPAVTGLTVEANDIVSCTFINGVPKAKLKIVKDSQPNDPQNFRFGLTLGDNVVSEFVLDDDGNNNNQHSNMKQFNRLNPGLYRIIEGPVDGWTLSDIDCGDHQIRRVDNAAYIQLRSGSDVTCTFENTKDGKITVIKNAIPNDEQDFRFRISRGDESKNFVLDDDPNSNTPNTWMSEVKPGQYVITEGQVEGWILHDIDCGDTKVERKDNSVVVNVRPGAEITCTFKNVKQGSITIIKDAKPNWDQDFDFTIKHGDREVDFTLSDENENDDNTKVFENVNPGEYSVWEHYTEGWDLRKIECNVDNKEIKRGAAFVVRPGQSVVCEFTNVGKGSLTVVKEAFPESDSLFDFTLRRQDETKEFSLQDNGDNQDGYKNYEKFEDVRAGRYVVREDRQEGWDLSHIYCFDKQRPNGDDIDRQVALNDIIGYGGPVDYERDGYRVAVNLEPGQNVVCKFVNVERGDVKVTKFNDLNQNGKFDEGEPTLPDWEINLNTKRLAVESVAQAEVDPIDSQGNSKKRTQTTDENGMTTFEDVRATLGTISILSENQQEGWNLSRIYCQRPNYDLPIGELRSSDVSAQDIKFNGEKIPVFVIPGMTTECFVGNYPDPILEIEKSNNKPEPTVTGDTVTYTIEVTNPDNSSCVFGYPVDPNCSEIVEEECDYEFSLFDDSYCPPILFNLAQDSEAEEYTAVTVTDLPPAGFTYIPGSYTADSNVRGDLKSQSITTEPTYSSPGVWNLTSALSNFLVPGEVVTLTYQATIQSVVSDGTHFDNAFTDGFAGSSDQIYGNVHSTNTPFVGTEVTVLTPAQSSGFVQGVQTLAQTGFPAYVQIGVGALIAGGAMLTLGGSRIRKWFKSTAKPLAGLLLATGLFLSLGSSASAFDSWTFDVIAPPTATNTSSFNLSYQVATIDPTNQYTVTLKENGNTIQTQSITTQYGDAKAFPVTFPSEGEYVYEVIANATAGGDAGSTMSRTVTIEYDASTPETPTYGTKTRNGNDWTITFTVPAGSDVRTIQIFASTSTSFTADSSTLVGEISATPGVEQSFTYNAPNSAEYFFAVRTIDSAGNPSAVVGDEQVVVSTVPGVTPTGSPAGSTAGSSDGAVLGEDNQDGQTGDQGDEQGDNDESQDDGGSSTTVLIVIALAAAAVAGYIYWQSRGTDE